MTETLDPVWLSNRTQAQALGYALHRMGFTTVVFKDRGHLMTPCVWVKREGREEFVYVALDDDDRWHFWWSLCQRWNLSPLSRKSA
jgi:hypothetical protein